MKKTSKISFFFFIFFYNYLWLRILAFPVLYNKYGSSGFIMLVFIMLGIIGITLLIPNNIFKLDLSNQLSNSFYKWINSAFIILEIITSVCFISYFINSIFIEESNIYVLFILLGISIVFVSNLLPNEIIDISTLFYITGLVLILLSLFITPKLEIEYLFKKRDISIISIVLLTVFLLFDNFKILINKEHLNVNKGIFLIPIIASVLLCISEYAFLLMTVGDEALSGLNYIGFLELSFMPVTKYFGDFNFVYIYLLLICCVFKNGFNLSVVKNSIILNKNVVNIITTILLVIGSIILLNCVEIEKLYMWVFMFIVLNISIFWMIGKCYFVRKT